MTQKNSRRTLRQDGASWKPTRQKQRGSCCFWNQPKTGWGKDIMQYNVTIKTIPERYAACVHTTIPCYAEEGNVWKTLCEETDDMRLVPDEPCYCAVTFLDGGIQGARRGDRGVEDRQGQLSRYGACEIQNASRRHRRKLHVPRPIREDRRGSTRPSPHGLRTTAMNATARCSTSTTSARTKRQSRGICYRSLLPGAKSISTCTCFAAGCNL